MPIWKAILPIKPQSVWLRRESLSGECMDGVYYFQPDRAVSRDQFVVMAMTAAGLDALEDVSVTGFSDDEAIPTWAKGYVSSALMAGVVKGVTDADGAISFNTGAAITKAEAILPYLEELDLVLVMTVEPGFGGRSSWRI